MILSPALTDESSVNVRDIADALPVARTNKLAILFKRSIGSEAALEVQKLFAEDLQKIAFLNSKILQIIQAANRALHDAGIRHAFYKGPLQQKILYGDYYAKPCLDADILVSPKDFKAARGALLDAGFRIPDGYSGLWWTFFLGEQPLLAPGQLYSVDLHHRLQQPGSPAPRHIIEFLDDVTPVPLGSQSVPTIGLRGIAMVAAMNLVKAVYHREPTGGHALDVLVAMSKMTADGIEETQAQARVQGLAGTLSFAAELAAEVFGVSNPLGRDAYKLPLDVARARQLIFAGEGQPLQRRKLLVHLCDRPLIDAPIEAIRWIMSEAALHSSPLTGKPSNSKAA
ncbi:hypothetical protein AEAC466_21545 [Asticcacaulis sp. AC466]|nr:hypothetical protein AEAC466_21545 [Asticcacaulis sp. AC466]